MCPSIYILGIVGSPRPQSNTEILVKEALDAARSLGANTGIFSVHGKRIAVCTGCLKCAEDGTICVIKDDFEYFYEEFMKADGIILGSPIYVMSIPAKLKACIERLSNSIFSVSQKRGKFPRLCKTVGVITQGNRRYGGQEITQQYIINAFIALKCIITPADFPDSYIGVGGCTFGNSKPGSIVQDCEAIKLSRVLGVRVAEMAKIIKSGLLKLKNELPDEYFSYI